MSVSTGVRGLRVGVSPRGNWVHAGVGGISYRRTLGVPPARRRGAPPSAPAALLQPPTRRRVAAPLGHDSTVEALREIDSASVEEMQDSSSRELLDEIAAARQAPRWWPVALLGAITALSGVAAADAPGWAVLLGACAVVPLLWWTAARDRLCKSVVLLYDLEEPVLGAYAAVVAAFEGWGAASACWHVAAAGRVRDRKYHAGADQLVSRARVRVAAGAVPPLRTNLDVPKLPAGRQVLAFLPDRLLVFDGDRVGAVSYRELRVEIGTTRFIEDGPVPPDAPVVDRTWRYVNRRGGPDRRFRDNPELPVVRYEEVLLESPSGLRELFQVSRPGSGESLRSALAEMARRVGEGRPASPG